MTVTYRGFDLTAERTGGGVWFSAFKQSCKCELTSGPSGEGETEASMIAVLKERVDDYIANPADYDHACDRVKADQ